MLHETTVTINKDRISESKSGGINIESPFQSKESLFMFLNPMVIALQRSLKK